MRKIKSAQLGITTLALTAAGDQAGGGRRLEAWGDVVGPRGVGLRALSSQIKQGFEVRCHALLEAGSKANPPAEPTNKAGWPKRGTTSGW